MLCYVLTKIFHGSLYNGTLPDDWYKANISLIYKKSEHARAKKL